MNVLGLGIAQLYGSQSRMVIQRMKKGFHILGQGQVVQLTNSRKKFLKTTNKHLFLALYTFILPLDTLASLSGSA